MLNVKEKNRYLTIDYKTLKLTTLDMTYLLSNNQGFIDGDKHRINISIKGGVKIWV